MRLDYLSIEQCRQLAAEMHSTARGLESLADMAADAAFKYGSHTCSWSGPTAPQVMAAYERLYGPMESFT